MNLLQQFVDFLTSQRNKHSFSTVKNYKADIGQFIGWFEKEFNSVFEPSRVTSQIIDQYKKSRNLSPISIQRHISSLRKFFGFLKAQGTIDFELFSIQPDKEKLEPDPWMLRNFKSFLYENKKSNLTIKNYINDIKNFYTWLSEVALIKYAWDVKEKNLLAKVNFSLVSEYKQRLLSSKFSPLTINRKLSSLRNYINWAHNQGFISSGHPELVSGSEMLNSSKRTFLSGGDAVQHDTEEVAYSSLPPLRLMQKSSKGLSLLFDYLFILPIAKTIEKTQHLFWQASGKNLFIKSKVGIDPGISFSNIQKEFYAPLDISIRYLPRHKRIWHYLRYVRPNWYKKYHSYSITHYLHFAILVILSCAVGFGIYNGIFADAQKKNDVLGIATSAPPRVLSFQGKLTDSFNNPIVKETNILFSIYSDGLTGPALWQETDSVKPDSNGAFSTSLGNNNPIADSLFTQNSKLFLGIKVGDSPELTPRQELVTSTLASNSKTLQGLEPITNTTKVSNVILALDSGGNLSIAGSKAHTFQAIGGQFILSGNILSLRTLPGSNSNIEIVPDGMGKIDIQKPIFNSSKDNNLSGVPGAVEFADNVAILATTSAQSALNINQNSTGTLISANTLGTAKFTVGNDGSGMFAGDLGINGGNLTSSHSNFNLLNTGVTTLNIGGQATTINLGVTGGTVNVASNLILSKDISFSSLTSNGGILYTNGSGKVLQVSAGSSTDCLMGGSSPSFSSCLGANLFNQTNGAIYANNNTVDVLFGGSATSSAKFAFININSGTPTASISGDITLNSAGTIRTTNGQTLTLGGTTTGEIHLLGQARIQISTQYSQRLCHSGSDGSSTQNVFLGDCNASQADIAEYYGSKDLTIEPGDIIVAAPGAETVGANSKAYVNKSYSSYQGGVIGIVSTNPYDSFGKNFGTNEYSFPVALAGRVPLKISLENGPIKAGDLLTSSSIPGVAMKATKTGPIVGKALEDLNSIDVSKAVGFYDPENKEYRSKANLPLDIPIKPGIIPIVKIYAFVNVSWYDPGAYLAKNGDLIISNTGSNGYTISSNSNNEALTNIGGFLSVIAANIKAGLINASEVITSSLVVATDNIIINGQNLKNYIAQVVSQNNLVSPIQTNQISTNIISPLSSASIIVKLGTPSGALIVQNASGSAVAKIDSQGNASFSGQLSASSGQFGDASISGVLRAKSIVADSIQGLEARISSIAANTIYSMHNNKYMDISSYSAQLTSVPDLQAERAQFNQGLMVFGSTSLADVSLAGQLSLGGTMFVNNNSIDVLGTDLSLQSLRQGGLSIMGGLVYIDTNGNLKIKGNVSISGKLAVNIISPLPNSSLVVENASGSGVLSVNQTGDIVASGSGTFTKLNFSLVAPALAISATELIASSSAGSANISPFQDEVTVRNALVTDKSVIYITPVGTPSAQSPFLMRQIPQKSFTVGVESPNKNPIPFNWLIIN